MSVLPEKTQPASPWGYLWPSSFPGMMPFLPSLQGMPEGRSRGTRLRLGSPPSGPQKRGQSGTGHLKCSCNSKPFPPGHTEIQLSMCATRHIPRIFIRASTDPAKNEQHGCMALPCWRKFLCRKTWVNFPHASNRKQILTKSKCKMALRGVVRTCQRLNHCGAHPSALRGSL